VLPFTAVAGTLLVPGDALGTAQQAEGTCVTSVVLTSSVAGLLAASMPPPPSCQHPPPADTPTGGGGVVCLSLLMLPGLPSICP